MIVLLLLFFGILLFTSLAAAVVTAVLESIAIIHNAIVIIVIILPVKHECVITLILVCSCAFLSIAINISTTIIVCVLTVITAIDARDGNRLPISIVLLITATVIASPNIIATRSITNRESWRCMRHYRSAVVCVLLKRARKSDKLQPTPGTDKVPPFGLLLDSSFTSAPPPLPMPTCPALCTSGSSGFVGTSASDKLVAGFVPAIVDGHLIAIPERLVAITRGMAHGRALDEAFVGVLPVVPSPVLAIVIVETVLLFLLILFLFFLLMLVLVLEVMTALLVTVRVIGWSVAPV